MAPTNTIGAVELLNAFPGDSTATAYSGKRSRKPIDFLQDKATSPYFIIHVVFDRNGKGDVLTEAEMIKV